MKRIAKLLMIMMMMAQITPILAATTTGTTTGGGTGGGFTEFNDAGEQGKTTVTEAVGAWKWVFAFVPVGFAWFYVSFVKNWLETEESQGRTQPRPARIGLLVVAVAAGILSAFAILGLFGMTFLGSTFSNTWTKLVVEVWKSIFGF